jgi:hypothetical protein
MEAPAAFMEMATVALAVITTALAAIVTCVTCLQFRIQRDELKLALFERRSSIYTSAKQLIVDAMTGGKTEKDKLLTFYWQVGESRFLLDEELSKLLDQILDKMTEFDHLEHMARTTERKPEERVRFRRRHQEARDWLIAQQSVLLERFKPFLSDWSV